MNKNKIEVTAVVSGTPHEGIEINVNSDVEGVISRVLDITGNKVGNINEWKLTYNNQPQGFNVKIEDTGISDGDVIFIDSIAPGGGGSNA